MTVSSLRRLGGALLLALAVVSTPAQAGDRFPAGPMTSPAPGRPDAVILFGIATAGGFHAYGSDGRTTPYRLTGIQRQEARSVESGELDLASREGRLIVVEGVPDGGWIYEAVVTETSGPLIAERVIRLLSGLGGGGGRPAR